MSCEIKILDEMDAGDLAAALNFHQDRVDRPAVNGIREPSDYLVEIMKWWAVLEACRERGLKESASPVESA